MAFKIDTEAVARIVALGDEPDLSGINFGLLEMLELWAEREWAKKEAGLPSEWDQSTWTTVRGEERTGTACGAACCIAGKAIQVTPGIAWTEYKWNHETSEAEYNPVDILSAEIGAYFDDVLVPEALVPEDDRDENPMVTQNGNIYSKMGASAAGRIILGLNHREASELFDGHNDLDRTKKVLADIRNGVFRQDDSDEVPTRSVQICAVTAQEYLESILPANVTADRFYRVWGRCHGAAGHPEGEHIFY